jgi:hypothetical protein
MENTSKRFRLLLAAGIVIQAAVIAGLARYTHVMADVLHWSGIVLRFVALRVLPDADGSVHAALSAIARVL